MLAHPGIVLHVKHGATSDISAVARSILDPDERRAVFNLIQDHSAYRSRMTIPVEERIEGSRLVELTLRHA